LLPRRHKGAAHLAHCHQQELDFVIGELGAKLYKLRHGKALAAESEGQA
jgi:hypothetical protein